MWVASRPLRHVSFAQQGFPKPTVRHAKQANQMQRRAQQFADIGISYRHIKIEKLVTRWPHCGHLIYMADDMMRCEHMERIRRRIVKAISDGKSAPQHIGRDLSFPNACIFLFFITCSE